MFKPYPLNDFIRTAISSVAEFVRVEGFGIGGTFRGGFDEPPYFAKFPPVYYSHPVARPYGISPYAVPPGIVPVEMTIAPKPKKVVNPFFPKAPEQEPKANKEKRLDAPSKQDAAKEKSASVTRPKRILNPFYSNFVVK